MKRVTEQPLSNRERVFVLKKRLKKILPAPLLNFYFALFPFVGSILYHRPSQKLKIIGVTGTDGKSSTVVYIARILKEAGFSVGYFSSVAFSDGLTEKPNSFKMTMPGRLFMQKFLSTLVKNKCDFAVLEITSEGIKQQRHKCIDFDVAVCTNIHPEHLESHGGFIGYKNTKAELFKLIREGKNKGIPKAIVVNGDDEHAKEFLNYEADTKITFGYTDGVTVRGTIKNSTIESNTLDVRYHETLTTLHLAQGGPFVCDNVLAAFAVCSLLNINPETARTALEQHCSVPGRFEVIKKKPLIIIDYAHTVAALTKLLIFLSENFSGEIHHVFGAAGGGRDRWKRPRLAELSERYTKTSILTEENSFDEPIQNILDDILKGFKDTHRATIIAQRTQAVAYALDTVTDSTLLLFTGKGSETVIAHPLGRKVSYNEKETICRLLDS